MELSGSYDPKELARVALGTQPADLVIMGGRLVNVYSGEVLDGQVVAVKGARIAYVGEPMGALVGPDTEVIDAAGGVLIPGLIDGHTHLDWFSTVGEFLRYAVPRGTTAVFSELSCIGDSAGYDGLVDFLDTTSGLPAKVFGMAPAISILNGHRFGGDRSITVEEGERLLELDTIAAVGESYWTRVVEGDDALFRLAAKAKACGKVVQGHTAGAHGAKLVASVAAGISSCHEPITPEHVFERVRLGMYTMLREGSVRRDLAATSAAVVAIPDTRRLVLVSDGVWPGDFARTGHMDYIVQQAIDLGIDPVRAIQMATLNVAEYFGLDSHIGGIAPGCCADLVVIPRIDRIQPSLVLGSGKVVARDGQLVADIRKPVFSNRLRQGMRLGRKVCPEDFRLTAPSSAVRGGHVAIRAIKLAANVVTEETVLTLPVVDGAVQTMPERDVLKMAVVDRHHATGKLAVAFATGYGLRKGALASTITFDGSQLAAIGASDEDLAAAVNRLAELGGGFVLWADGRPIAELALPICGTIGEQPLPEMSAMCDKLVASLVELGAVLPNPLLPVITITFTAVPTLRLRLGGLVDVRRSAIVDPFLVD